MGLFSSIKKAFKKVVKGVSKVIKKGVSAVKKVVKKISKSKILRTLATVAAVVVTGGAALGAFPGLASTQIGSAIVGAGNWISSLPVVGTLAKPFQAAGSFVGETIYSAGAKAGLIKDVDMAAKTLQAAGQGTYESIKGAIAEGLTTEAEVISKASAFVSGGTGAIATAPTLGAEELAKVGSKELLQSSAAKTVGSFAGSFVKPLVDVGKQIAVGYGVQKALGADEYDPQGQAFGFSTEQKSQMDALQMAQSQTGVDISKAYDTSYTFGPGDIGYLQKSLYQSPVLKLT